MALSQLFWDVLMPWNLKSTYFSLKIIHFLSLNIWYVIYVVFWIKYWNLKLPHHCILFLFTICTVSQLFWNRVCTCILYITCICMQLSCSFSAVLITPHTLSPERQRWLRQWSIQRGHRPSGCGIQPLWPHRPAWPDTAESDWVWVWSDASL